MQRNVSQPGLHKKRPISLFTNVVLSRVFGQTDRPHFVCPRQIFSQLQDGVVVGQPAAVILVSGELLDRLDLDLRKKVGQLFSHIRL